MEEKNSEFRKISELLPGAVERLFERVKQRKIEEFMEKIKYVKSENEK